MLGGYAWATVEGLEVEIATECGKRISGAIETTAQTPMWMASKTQNIEKKWRKFRN